MPDMVVTDLNMPGMNGFEMVRSLKMAGADYANLQVVAVTALSAGDVADRVGCPKAPWCFRNRWTSRQLKTWPATAR